MFFWLWTLKVFFQNQLQRDEKFLYNHLGWARPVFTCCTHAQLTDSHTLFQELKVHI